MLEWTRFELSDFSLHFFSFILKKIGRQQFSVGGLNPKPLECGKK